MKVAVAYDRADEKSRKIARLALEDFMETSIPAMATRRTERTAADDNPDADTWHIRDTYWRETLSQWLKEHPDASISSGDVPEWVKFNLLRAVNVEGLPGWTREELREREARLFEHPRTEQPTITVRPEIDDTARRKSLRDIPVLGIKVFHKAGSDAKSGEAFQSRQPIQNITVSGKSETKRPSCVSCAQCPLADRCSQRFSENPFPELRDANMYVLYDDGSADYRKLSSASLSDDQCPLYRVLKGVLKAILPKGTLENQILLNENGTALLPAGNIDLPTILGMINPAIQGALSKALKPVGNDADDLEKM